MNDKNLTEYEKALHFLELGCGCGCSSKVPKEEFAELREAFQALSKPEQDIFLMAQLKTMDGGSINKTYLNMLGIGRAHFENVRDLGTVKAQEAANGPFQEFKLLKTSKSPTPQAIKSLSFPVLKPLPMELKRQEYLYHNIRPFVLDEFKDITCPRPTYNDNE
ncbi:hypothetical protein G9A89_023977 [Geosiphon pyriformis]|nr:hypothetical protein G9A89_023977 [Geosiphon pyriformis]